MLIKKIYSKDSPWTHWTSFDGTNLNVIYISSIQKWLDQYWLNCSASCCFPKAVLINHVIITFVELMGKAQRINAVECFWSSMQIKYESMNFFDCHSQYQQSMQKIFILFQWGINLCIYNRLITDEHIRLGETENTYLINSAGIYIIFTLGNSVGAVVVYSAAEAFPLHQCQIDMQTPRKSEKSFLRVKTQAWPEFLTGCQKGSGSARPKFANQKT